jgi:hypothetical protein
MVFMFGSGNAKADQCALWGRLNENFQGIVALGGPVGGSRVSVAFKVVEILNNGGYSSASISQNYGSHNSVQIVASGAGQGARWGFRQFPGRRYENQNGSSISYLQGAHKVQSIVDVEGPEGVFVFVFFTY